MGLWTIVVLALVCLPLIGVRLLRAWYMRASTNPQFFAAAIAKFATADRDHPPPDAPIVFVGSSSIRFWRTLQADMAPLPVLNRGFGGARLSHVNHFADGTVIKYQPRAVVLYAGDNDLDRFTGTSPADVVREFEAFVRRVQTAVPHVRIYFLSIKPSRLRWADWPKQRAANEQIAAICARGARLGYIDVALPMLTRQPPPRDLFRLDGVHLSAKGYALWTRIVRARLAADLTDAAGERNATTD